MPSYGFPFVADASQEGAKYTSAGFGDQTSARFVLRLFQYLLIFAAIAHRNFSRR